MRKKCVKTDKIVKKCKQPYKIRVFGDFPLGGGCTIRVDALLLPGRLWLALNAGEIQLALGGGCWGGRSLTAVTVLDRAGRRIAPVKLDRKRLRAHGLRPVEREAQFVRVGRAMLAAVVRVADATEVQDCLELQKLARRFRLVLNCRISSRMPRRFRMVLNCGRRRLRRRPRRRGRR